MAHWALLDVLSGGKRFDTYLRRATLAPNKRRLAVNLKYKPDPILFRHRIPLEDFRLDESKEIVRCTFVDAPHHAVELNPRATGRPVSARGWWPGAPRWTAKFQHGDLLSRLAGGAWRKVQRPCCTRLPARHRFFRPCMRWVRCFCCRLFPSCSWWFIFLPFAAAPARTIAPRRSACANETISGCSLFPTGHSEAIARVVRRILFHQSARRFARGSQKQKNLTNRVTYLADIGIIHMLVCSACVIGIRSSAARSARTWAQLVMHCSRVDMARRS